MVGNPPYVRQEELRGLKPYFKAAYPKVYAGTADLFVYFFGQALALLQTGGRTSYISSNSWLRANYATALRRTLRQETTIESLIDLGDNRVFEDAPDLYPSIHVVKNETPPEKHVADVVVYSRGEGINIFEQQIEEKQIEVWIHDQPDEGWQLESQASRLLFQKLKSNGKTLGRIAKGNIFYGIRTFALAQR